MFIDWQVNRLAMPYHYTVKPPNKGPDSEEQAESDSLQKPNLLYKEDKIPAPLQAR